MRECYRFMVTGRVQGVYFRQSSLAEATRLGLTGWIRNRADGAVEGVACGAAAELEQFKHWLYRGPPAAQVTHLGWMSAEPLIEPEFKIRR